MKSLLYSILLLCFTQNSYATSLIGRLGIGTTNQVATGISAISMKLQRNRKFGIGGIFGVDSSTDSSTYAIGAKTYHLIYDEPQLNFYSSFTAIMFTYNDTAGDTKNGYQAEGSFGSEFSFQGLESVGFSFEFGLGLIKNSDGSSFKTVGHHMLQSAVHFYL